MSGQPVLVDASGNLGSVGTMINSSQPLFFSKITIQTNNVTGDGTTYTIIYDTATVNQGSNYNNATGIFTAPVTGNYMFTATCQLLNLGAAHISGYFQITSTGFSAISNLINPFAVSVVNQVGFQSTVILNMTAGDTAKAQITVSGGTKTVEMGGTNGWFSGYLVC